MGFAEDCKGIGDTPGPVTNEAASSFLAAYPLPEVFRELSAAGVAPEAVEAASSALQKVLDTVAGASLLPEVLPYAEAALQSAASPALRRLGVQQLARALQQSALEPAAQQHAVGLLLHGLQDGDIGVAAAAEQQLVQLGSNPAGLALLAGAQQPAAMELRQLAAGGDPVLRARALTLVTSLASTSPAGAAAVAAAGLLQPLMDELGRPGDLLSCMAALQLVSDAAVRCDPGMAAQLEQVLVPHLGPLYDHPEPVLQSWALKAGAQLLAAALQGGAGGMGAAAEQPLLVTVTSLLDISSTRQVAAEVEEAAVDAVGTVGASAAGAHAVLLSAGRLAGDVAYRALGRPPAPAIRAAALHALGALAGADRAQGRRAAALLPPPAEDALRAAVYQGADAAGSALTLAEVLSALLGQPFLEQRVAVYRALSALLLREWLAAEVCANAALLDFLLSSGSETTKQGCEWRHACVTALAATVAAAMGAGGGQPTANGVSAYHTAFTAAAERVQEAVRAGPFGAGRAAPSEHLVATLPGP